jgi:hypothetical protein
LSSIICDVASFHLFKPVRSEPLHDNNRKFLHIPFANKGIDDICLFVVEHFTANAVSVAIGDNGNRLILKYGGISSTTSFLLRMLLMLIASIPLLANGIWRNFLLFSTCNHW